MVAFPTGMLNLRRAPCCAEAAGAARLLFGETEEVSGSLPPKDWPGVLLFSAAVAVVVVYGWKRLLEVIL